MIFQKEVPSQGCLQHSTNENLCRGAIRLEEMAKLQSRRVTTNYYRVLKHYSVRSNSRLPFLSLVRYSSHSRTWTRQPLEMSTCVYGAKLRIDPCFLCMAIISVASEISPCARRHLLRQAVHVRRQGNKLIP